MRVLHPLFLFFPIEVVIIDSDIIIYTDASKGDEVCGLGYVIEGDISFSQDKILKGNFTSMEAEFFALIEALRVASAESERGVRVEVYSDCEPLIRKMRGSEPAPDKWEEYRASYNWLFDNFDENSILRTCSRDKPELKSAHDLARKALNRGRLQT